MNNFIETFKMGKAGKNIGLTTGIKLLDKAINGIQRKTSIGIAAAPKVGKTTLCDYCFVISPYLQAIILENLGKINWIYFSYEIDRISKEFKYAAFFMAYDYGVYNVPYKDKIYEMNQDYLMWRQLHINSDGTEEIVQITEEHQEMLKKIYENRIEPMFGEYDDRGNRIKMGKIDFIQDPENPTGLYKYLLHYAGQHGKFLTEEYETIDDNKAKIKRTRITGYTPDDPELYTIVVTDHVRKLRMERGYNLKQTIDKWMEYQTWLRNTCGFTFINVIHSNRNVSNVDRLKYAGEFIFPTADDCKDSGNPAEECTIFMTMFNPNDEKYNLNKHFGVELANYPNYRSIHITDSRYTKCPVHIQQNMFGGINMFTNLNPGT